MQKAFKAENIVIAKLEDEGLRGAWQVVTFTSKNNKISKKQAVDSMGKNKKRFKVERIWRPLSSDEWKKKPTSSPDSRAQIYLYLMPIYVYKHPEEEEYTEIFQGMNDEHVYSEDGVEWQRVFLSPNASIDSSIDPFSNQQYIDATANKKGTMGDMMDLSAELSAKRAEKSGGKDPIKEKFYNDYATERKGTEHPDRLKEKGYESKNVKIEYD